MNTSEACKRAKVLRNELFKHEMNIRPDSMLCKAYLEGTTPLNAETVAYVSALHRYLYDFTPYGQRCAVELPAQAHLLSSAMGGYLPALKYLKVHQAPIIKAEILQQYPVPDQWPWMVQESTDSCTDSTTSDCEVQDALISDTQSQQSHGTARV